LLQSGLLQWAASQYDQVPSGLYLRDQGAQCLSYPAFGAIALNCFAKRASGSYAEPGIVEIVGMSDQHDKRVRIRFSHSPHPLEVG
jgi:hypothetical protein